MSLNKAMFIGNLGADVELKFTANGKAIAGFRLAVSNGYGEKETVEWVSVVVWDKLAENCAQYLHKGSLCYVEGRLQTRSWEGQDGQRRYRTEVIANDVQFLDRKAGEQAAPEAEPDDEMPF